MKEHSEIDELEGLTFSVEDVATFFDSPVWLCIKQAALQSIRENVVLMDAIDAPDSLLRSGHHENKVFRHVINLETILITNAEFARDENIEASPEELVEAVKEAFKAAAKKET